MSRPEVIPVCRPTVGATALERLGQCLESGWLGYGPLCRELEARFTVRGGHALATANCTAALHLAARLCRRERRSRVLVPAITFVSTVMAFAYAGLEVELVDVDPHTGLIDPQDLARRIDLDCCAVVAVHLYGQKAELAALRELCDAHELTLIEDCAHRIDLFDTDPPLGDIACYSFNAVKEAPGGESGLLWCRDGEWMDRARQISNLGLTIDTPSRAATPVHRDYAFGDELGLKLRGFDLAATLVLANLDELAGSRAARARIFAAFDAALGRGGVMMPLARDLADSFLMYVALTDAGQRDALRQRLAQAGIATSFHYPSLSRHSGFSQGSLAGAETFDQQVVTLPCFPAMSDDQLDRIVAALVALDCDAPARG
ncbi:MAG: aminotransferase class I/II-fold pyridoxal phosphate-dependent enzyme [Novosphingobium sp.]